MQEPLATLPSPQKQTPCFSPRRTIMEASRGRKILPEVRDLTPSFFTSLRP